MMSTTDGEWQFWKEGKNLKVKTLANRKQKNQKYLAGMEAESYLNFRAYYSEREIGDTESCGIFENTPIYRP